MWGRSYRLLVLRAPRLLQGWWTYHEPWIFVDPWGPYLHVSLLRGHLQRNGQTATIGSGLVWDDVYAVLDPLNLTVVGDRFSGVGVAGYSLGGGYS
ncbi:hypothetical protein B0H14DRAFT_210827 [Mycena olivaceomarginata]|nr:hypothetical protein B0H14DRAFT_210827 [Mycena olivaceomarginata]